MSNLSLVSVNTEQFCLALAFIICVLLFIVVVPILLKSLICFVSNFINKHLKNKINHKCIIWDCTDYSCPYNRNSETFVKSIYKRIDLILKKDSDKYDLQK